MRSWTTHSSFKITISKMWRSETSNFRKAKISQIRMRTMMMRKMRTKMEVQLETRNPLPDRA